MAVSQPLSVHRMADAGSTTSECDHALKHDDGFMIIGISIGNNAQTKDV
jgi:hypothetical protein